jgi:hypothetical protein
MDSHVAQLVEMGFDARAATAALHDRPHFEEALNFLMSNPDWLPGVLHATSSTPAEAVVAYEVSVPRVVAGTYFEISVQSRGQEWTVQKKITQFEELHRELSEMFSREHAHNIAEGRCCGHRRVLRVGGERWLLPNAAAIAGRTCASP